MSLFTVSLVGVALVALCSAIEGFAQVFFKKSALAAQAKKNGQDIAIGGLSSRMWALSGISLFALEALLYTVALRYLDLATAYPLGALSFVAVTLLSRWLLRERIEPGRWIGVALILVGAALVVMHA